MLFFSSSWLVGSVIVHGTVARDVDGDTLWVKRTSNISANSLIKADKDNAILKIRMLGIDAPESCFPTENGCVGQGEFGKTAKKILAGLAPVGIRVKVDDQGLDKFKRTLGRVFVGSEDIDIKMITLGWAIPYIICGGKSCDESYLEKEYTSQYLAACSEARNNGLGIWNPQNPLTEMPFEFRLRISGRKPNKIVGDYFTREIVNPEDYDEIDVCRRVFFLSKADAENAGFGTLKKH
jgi:endonuclease YncB( thermonuclease family)